MAALIDEKPSAAPPQMLTRHLDRVWSLLVGLPSVEGLTDEQLRAELPALDRVITRLQPRRLHLIHDPSRRHAVLTRAGTETVAFHQRT